MPPAESTPRRISIPVWWLSVPLWGAVVLLAAAFAASALLADDLRESDRSGVFLGVLLFFLETFRFHVSVALLVVVLLAWRLRTRRLAVACAVVLLYALGPTIRDVLPKQVAAAATGGGLSVFNANLLAWNRSPEHLRDEILASDADVVVLQEYHTRWESALADVLAERYPYSIAVPREDAFGNAVFSRRPFLEKRSDLTLGIDGCPQIRVVIDVDGEPVAVYSVHLAPPISIRHAIMQRHGVADLIDVLADEPLPAIVCGDFNMTEDCAYARQLRAAGLRDTHTAVGFGRQATWPNRGKFSIFPGVRIDHIYFTDDRLVCLDATTGVGAGSDHRPIAAKLALREASRQVSK